MNGKLKLELDDLQVDSFEPQDAPSDTRGTVHGLVSRICGMITQLCDTMYDGTCNGYGTCNIYPCKPI
jgi:hypothetical protein